MNTDRHRFGEERQTQTILDASTVVLNASSVAGLRAIRRELGDALVGCGWRIDRVGDAQLVLAEIATNAFVHDGARDFSAEVTCTSTAFTMTTRHAGTTLPPSAPVSPPLGTPPGGRGLVIVDELCASRSVSSVDGVTSTAVVLYR